MKPNSGVSALIALKKQVIKQTQRYFKMTALVLGLFAQTLTKTLFSSSQTRVFHSKLFTRN